MVMDVFSIYYEDLGIFLYLTPIVCVFCFAFVLLIKPNRKQYQLYLAISFIILGIGMSLSLWYDRYIMTGRDEILRSVNFILTGITTIAILFYFTSLLQPTRLTKRYMTTHITGIILFSGMMISSEFLTDNSFHIIGWRTFTASSLPALLRLTACLCIVLLEIYACTQVGKMYVRQKENIKNSRLILYNIYFFILLGMCDLIWMINPSIYAKISINIASLILIFCIFLLGYRYNIQRITSKQTEKRETQSSGSESVLRNSLLNYFDKEYPYLNPDLSLKDVANILNTNTTYLSRVINREFNTNFYSFINNYRIDHAISLIKKSKSRIASDTLYINSGFKSRSVFYKLFKEKTGHSPQDYIQKKEKAETSIG